MKALHHLMLQAALCTLLLATGRAALAQGSAAAAEALFDEGRSEMAAGNLDSACAKFRESDKLDPAPGTQYNLADCEEQRGNFATAWELFKAAEGKLDPADARYAIAKQRREAVAPKVPKLRIVLEQGAPEGTTVRMGEAEFGGGSLGVALPLDPGNHELVVFAPGYAERRFAVTLQVGKTVEVAVSPGPQQSDAGSADAPAASSGVEDTQPGSGGNRTLGYVIGGVGIAGLIVGGVTGALVLGQKSIANEHCFPELRRCDQEGVDANNLGSTLGVVSTIGFAVGVVGVGVGTYLILTSDDEGSPQSALMTRVGPMAGQVSFVQSW